jgi:hypothetical protein
MKKTVLTFGFIAGAMLSVMMLITLPFHDQIGNEWGMVIGYSTMVLAFLMVYFGVRSYRDNVAGGSVGFGRALAVGSLIALVASSCYVATWQVMYFSSDRQFLREYQEKVIEKARAAGESEASIAKQQAEMARFAEMYENPFFNAAVTFLEPLPVALLFAFGTAGILARRRKGSGSAVMMGAAS